MEWLRRLLGVEKRSYQELLRYIPGGQTSYAHNVNTDTALAVSAVYAAVDRISSTLAMVPLLVYRRRDGGRIVANNHDQYFLMKESPSELYTSFQFRKTLFTSVLLEGNGYAQIERRNGRPIRYKLLHPSNVTNVVEQDNEVYYFISGMEAPVSSNDVIHITTLSRDGLIGKSPIRIHAESISASLHRNTYSVRSLDNGSMLTGTLEFPQTLKPEQKEAIRTEWQNKYGGVGNAGAVPILDGGVQFKPLSITPDDAQLIDTMKFSVEDIARIYGIPPHMIGHLERSTNNNIEHQAIEFVQYCLTPWAVQFEQELNRKIFRQGERKDYYTKLELNALMRGDVAARREFYRLLLDRGVFSINEVRALEELNEVEGGEMRMVQASMVPLNLIEQRYKNGNA